MIYVIIGGEIMVVKRICQIINNIIIAVLIILVCIFFVPKILGCENLAVLSGSMEPKISVGSMVIVQDVDPNDLEVGDIITYKISDTTLVTHRIVSIDQDAQEIVTKGDANDVIDGEPVSFSNVVGKLFISIPFLGYISIYMQGKAGIAIICGVVGILILLNYLPDVFIKDEEKND